MQITKNATDNDKNNYKGYGICFDERSEFGHTITEVYQKGIRKNWSIWKKL